MLLLVGHEPRSSLPTKRSTSDARARDARELRGCATPAGLTDARRPQCRRAELAVSGPGMMRAPVGWLRRPRSATMGPAQHDIGGDEPRDHAKGESTHKARGSRLNVKDVGSPGPWPRSPANQETSVARRLFELRLRDARTAGVRRMRPWPHSADEPVARA